mmetsp:Transcript_6981/g.14537  ORF Transcript_6981/g.14537 Transcript_6981/m.14537 type:complete len:224 (-) Transcript_6981:291-962(-)
MVPSLLKSMALTLFPSVILSATTFPLFLAVTAICPAAPPTNSPSGLHVNFSTHLLVFCRLWPLGTGGETVKHDFCSPFLEFQTRTPPCSVPSAMSGSAGETEIETRPAIVNTSLLHFTSPVDPLNTSTLVPPPASAAKLPSLTPLIASQYKSERLKSRTSSREALAAEALLPGKVITCRSGSTLFLNLFAAILSFICSKLTIPPLTPFPTRSSHVPSFHSLSL